MFENCKKFKCEILEKSKSDIYWNASAVIVFLTIDNDQLLRNVGSVRHTVNHFKTKTRQVVLKISWENSRVFDDFVIGCLFHSIMY